MADLRVEKLAELLVNYSVGVKTGRQSGHPGRDSG